MSDIVSLTIKDLSLYYGDFKALNELNLEIEVGKITALIGPSGCGKSTFLRTLNRMNDLIDSVKIEGQIIYNDKDILAKNLDVIELRKEIGMVFQKPNPFPMSIYDNVAYGPRAQGIKDKATLDHIVEESLKKAALYEEVKHKLNRSGLSLSGGQQQRLCIARTIATNPKIILMDEPTSALDPISTAKIEQLMLELKENYTIIVVTHSMQQARRVSDYCAFFLSGEVIEIDKTKKIFSTPQDKRTEDYVTGRFG